MTQDGDLTLDTACLLCGAPMTLTKEQLGTVITCRKCKGSVALARDVIFAESDDYAREIVERFTG